ncbi:hypothetical protein [Holophaga foetida]|uniref:hypothetical protein n=1 Tax=Holophaga foetida TaxID=35839 RepID=UPI0002473790|nr:hypothetical protein [Holophaga foetida]
MKVLKRKTVALSPQGHAHGQHRPSAEELFHAPGESPAVYSITKPVAFAQGVGGTHFAAAMIRCVEGVRDWAAHQRHLVGHIKVFIENGSKDHLWLASTGKRISVQSSPGWDAAVSETFQVHFTAIIFGPGQDHLEEIVAEHIQRELSSIQP